MNRDKLEALGKILETMARLESASESGGAVLTIDGSRDISVGKVVSKGRPRKVVHIERSQGVSIEDIISINDPRNPEIVALLKGFYQEAMLDDKADKSVLERMKNDFLERWPELASATIVGLMTAVII